MIAYTVHIGDPKRNFKGGEGVAKIIAKRTAEGGNGEAVARKMVEVVVLGSPGKIYGPQAGQRVNLSYEGHTAVLSLYREGNKTTWLLTGWEDETSGAASGGYGPPGATHVKPMRTRPDVVAEASSGKEDNTSSSAVNEKSGLPVSTVKYTLATLGADGQGFAVVQSVDELPDELQAQMKKDQALDAPGVFWQGTPFLIADNHASAANVMESAFHEGFHDGIIQYVDRVAKHLAATNKTSSENTAIFLAARRVRSTMKQIWLAHADAIRANAKSRAPGGMEYEFDLTTEQGRMQATEEWLADKPAEIKRGWLERLVADIRKFMRAVAEKLGVALDWTEADVRAFVADVMAARRQRMNMLGVSVGPFYQGAYHGSGAQFENFDSAYMGTGEGAQAFGYGHYAAGRKELGEHYRNVAVSNQKRDTPLLLDEERYVRTNNGWTHEETGDEIYEKSPEGIALNAFMRDIGEDGLRERINDIKEYGEDFDGELEATEEAISLYGDIKRGVPGQLYEVEIPDDHELLDWDRPLSKQPAGVREKLAAEGFVPSKKLSDKQLMDRGLRTLNSQDTLDGFDLSPARYPS